MAEALLVIPAIDLQDGACVRLRQGRPETATVFSDDPPATAARWLAAGARRLHLVDLDGAFAGAPVNAAIIARLAAACPALPIQLGGGIRTLATIEHYLQAGVRYVILGTQAVRQPEFVSRACAAFPGRIMVGLDARAGQVATDGWAQLARVEATELARRFGQAGISALIYTDIARDGMMQGVNIAATVAVARAAALPVIASGGISSMDDIRAVAAATGQGVCAAITGRALYEGTLDLAAAQRYCDELAG